MFSWVPEKDLLGLSSPELTQHCGEAKGRMDSSKMEAFGNLLAGTLQFPPGLSWGCSANRCSLSCPRCLLSQLQMLEPPELLKYQRGGPSHFFSAVRKLNREWETQFPFCS